MKFKSIYLKNIRSYQEQLINFPEGSLLLAGDIGSGKTTILLAIEYALFGLQPGQRGSSLLRNDSDEGEVALEMEVEGDSVKIERKLKRKSKSISNDYAAVTINGQKMESSMTEIKTKILEILGYPMEFIKKNNILYRYTVYTPQEQMKQIILEDSETRLNIIRSIFGIDKYRRIRNNLSTLTYFLKSEIKMLEGETKTIDEEREKLKKRKERISEINSTIEEKQLLLKQKKEERKSRETELSELDEKIKEREKLEKEKEKTQVFITTKRENLNNITKELRELNDLIKEATPFEEKELEKIEKQIEEHNKNIESLNSRNMELSSQIYSLKQKNEDEKGKKDRIFKLDFCPTCLQNVSDSHKHNILNKTESSISETQRSIKELEMEKSRIDAYLKKEKENLNKNSLRKSELETLKTKSEYLNQYKERKEKLERTKAELEKDLDLLEKHVSSLKENILKYSSALHQSERKKSEISEAQEEEREVEISIAQLRKERDLVNNEISEISNMIEEKEETQKKAAYFKELNDWLSNQFSQLIDFTERNVLMKLRMEFSKLFSKWFRILVSSDYFDVRLDETFTPVIIHKETEMDYSFLSGGERTSVALAYRLALNQIINSLVSGLKTRGIVILDEPTDGFSEMQIDKIRDILEELNSNQLIIVSHENKIESFVDNIIRVKKQGSLSQIETFGLEEQETQPHHKT